MSTLIPLAEPLAGPPPGRAGGTDSSRTLRGRLAPLLLLTVITVVLILRLVSSHSHPAASGPNRLMAMPSSPAIAATWGIRFTAVLLEADRGLLDVRYQVVDPAKSGRIHGGGTSTTAPGNGLANMPSIILETTGRKISPSSALMHFEHFHFQTELTGSTYSMIYGNSSGLLHVGDKVTIQMSDGRKLEHIVVAN